MIKIEERTVKELNYYENNPRKNDAAVKAVAESIKQFGFKVPLVIKADGEIIAGHTRYKAALALNIKKVPVIVADDLTEDQVKAFRLADNKVGEKSEWIDSLLQEELNEIPEINMGAFGFLNEETIPEQIQEDDEIGASIVRAVCNNNQRNDIVEVLETIDPEGVEKYGNENKNGNRLYGVIKKWRALKI